MTFGRPPDGKCLMCVNVCVYALPDVAMSLSRYVRSTFMLHFPALFESCCNFEHVNM